MKIYAIDPGNDFSAFCIIDADTLRPLLFDKRPNKEVLRDIKDTSPVEDYRAVIEMVESYGMAVGKEVYETVFWIGRFYEALTCKCPVDRIYRKEVKLHICGTTRAKDTNIRQALIDRFAKHDFKNGKGTVKNKDWFYGFSKDIWSAYAVGLTYIETKLNLEG
jgi:hypothetical protein